MALVDSDHSTSALDAETAPMNFGFSVSDARSLAGSEATVSGGIFLQIWKISRPFVALIISVLCVLLVHSALPQPLESGPGFQEVNAMEVLRDFATKPHAYLSRADKAVATRLAEKMKDIANSTEGSLASVVVQDVEHGRGSNIVGIVHGSRTAASSEPFVMVSAHFDSVSAGPGATDDGVGTAVVVEAFRVFVTYKPLCDVFFVLVDGEEARLLGSEHFMGSEYGRRARVVINLEGSGAASTEYLIRTNSPWIVNLYAGHAKHPAAYSIAEKLFTLFGRGYTDASQYARNGAHVADLVFVENRFVYHTQEDSLDNVLPGALQHEGDNVLSLLLSASYTDLPDAFQNPVRDPIYSDTMYFTFLRSVVWCSSPLVFQMIAFSFTACNLISLKVAYKHNFSETLREASWLALGILVAMLLQAFAASLFVEPRDVRSWYWAANTIRLLHPAVWLLLTASLLQKWREPEADDVCRGCLFVASILNLLLITFVPELACASMWLLLPATVPAISLLLTRVSDRFQHDPEQAHMNTDTHALIWFCCSVVGLILAFDNVLAWIPTFLYYLDSMQLPALAAELLASLIATFASLLLWPFIAALRSDPSKILVVIAALAVIGVTIAEISVSNCRTCAYPVR